MRSIIMIKINLMTVVLLVHQQQHNFRGFDLFYPSVCQVFHSRTNSVQWNMMYGTGKETEEENAN
jgi:hypothetical protein